MSRRELLRTAARMGGLVGLSAALGVCAPSSGKQERQGRGGSRPHVTIGFVPIACAAPLLVADGLGLFDKHGLDVTLRKFSGWADLWTAYATGALDVAHMLSPMPIAIDSGATDASRPTELAFTQNTNGQALTLAADHHPHVNTVGDLRGMVLGIPFEYSVHALLLRDYLAAGGVHPVRDVELRLLRPADMIAQLEVGTIDGFIGPEPFNQRALQSGAGRIFVPTKQMWDGHPCCSIAMAREGQSSIRTPLIAALSEAATYVDNPAHAHDAAPLLAQEKYLNQKAELIEPALIGEYLTWSDEQVTDPNMIRFGDTTQASALCWMATQMARWGLGGEGVLFDDHSIRTAAERVLPAEAGRSEATLMINGQEFDPRHPTAGYTAEARQKD